MIILNKNQIAQLENDCDACLKKNIENYIIHLSAQGLSLNSISSYISDLLKALKLYKKNKIINLDDFLKIDLNDVRKILSTFQANRSQARFISSLKKFFQYNKATSIVNKLKKPKTPKQFPKLIKEEDFLNLMNVNISKTEWINLRNQALVILLYTCGMRISEALALSWKDISESFCKILKGKRQKARFCPILKPTAEKLDEYKKILEFLNIKKEYIFINKKLEQLSRAESYNIVKKISLKIGIEPISPHTLRHACASHLLQNGCNLKSISNLLGHESLDTTKIYISHSINEIQKIHSKIMNKN